MPLLSNEDAENMAFDIVKAHLYDLNVHNITSALTEDATIGDYTTVTKYVDLIISRLHDELISIDDLDEID